MQINDILLNPVKNIVNAVSAGNRIRAPSGRRNVLTVETPGIANYSNNGAGTSEGAKKLSAVYAAVDIRSNSMSVLPAYVMNTTTRERVNHPILELLSTRPNEAMTASVRKKLLSESIDLTGNAYDWIIRDPRSMVPVELIPLPGHLVWMDVDDRHHIWYYVRDPITGEPFRLPGEDVCHYKGPTRNGYLGVSVLTYAQDTIRGGLAAQAYNANFYESGGQPAGVLSVDTDIGGYVNDKDGNPTTKTKKDAIREEWERVHSGPTNSHRIAVLDNGLKYKALSISQKDSQFVEQQNITVQDIARFFNMPLYKLQSGKQSYNSNEQNAIEYLASIQPRVTQTEEEQTYKLLMLSDRKAGLEIRYNMMAALRSDSQSRSNYYKNMWGIGAYSVNDIRALEDMPDVEGGDEYMASLNYVPLSLWKELSINRNLPNGGENNSND